MDQPELIDGSTEQGGRNTGQMHEARDEDRGTELFKISNYQRTDCGHVMNRKRLGKC